MKTKKTNENNSNFHNQIICAVKDFITISNTRNLDDYEKLSLFLKLTLKIYASQTRINTAFIEDLLFIIEDFINSFSNNSNFLWR